VRVYGRPTHEVLLSTSYGGTELIRAEEAERVWGRFLPPMEELNVPSSVPPFAMNSFLPPMEELNGVPWAIGNPARAAFYLLWRN